MKVEKAVEANPEANSIDPRDFRSALGSFATGVTVITARDDSGMLSGLTVNSFASVSLDPPLVLWSLSLFTPALEAFQNCRYYAINVLAADQLELSNHFAKASDDQARFAGIAFDPGMGGAPLLRGCCAWFECSNQMRYAGGDHLIFVGRVQGYRYEERPPLIFHGGQYRELALP